MTAGPSREGRGASVTESADVGPDGCRPHAGKDTGLARGIRVGFAP